MWRIVYPKLFVILGEWKILPDGIPLFRDGEDSIPVCDECYEEYDLDKRPQVEQLIVFKDKNKSPTFSMDFVVRAND